MARILFSLAPCVMVAVCFSALAQERPDPREAVPSDIIAGAVDPFNVFHQRKTFELLAGVDSQMDEREFKEDREKKVGEGFTRPFDTWDALLLFDTDKDGMIGWLEATEYRLALRSVCLSRFDEDRDKRLQREERVALLATLNEANLLQWLRDRNNETGKPQPEPPVQPMQDGPRVVVLKSYEETSKEINERDMEEDRRALALLASEPEPWLSRDDEKRELANRGVFMLEDQDGDGVANEKDWVLQGQRLKQVRRINRERAMEKALETFDVNRNGKLDPEESGYIKQKKWNSYAGYFDKHSHGTIDLGKLGLDDETIRVILEHPERMEWYPIVQLNAEERRAFEASDDYESLMIQREFDENGDGVHSDQEGEPLYRMGGMWNSLKNDEGKPEELRRYYGDYRSEYWRDFDGDGDGKLNENEVAVLNAAFLRESRGKAPITNYPYNPWDDKSHLP